MVVQVTPGSTPLAWKQPGQEVARRRIDCAVMVTLDGFANVPHLQLPPEDMHLD